MERIVHTQIYAHLNVNNLLSEAQFRFRNNHSTSTCIHKLLNDVYLNIDNGLMTGVVFLDLKKAFDTVDHTILLSKLRCFCFSDTAIDWMKNYPTGREQATKSMGHKSTFLPIKCGVPQGSILGPLLFISYMNDLSQYVNYCKLSLYADDTALYTSGRSQVDIMLNFRMELTIIDHWMHANKLTVNAKKTKYTIFGSKKQLRDKPDLNLTIGPDKIDRVNSFKYLGIILDEHLSFNEHVDYVVSKTSKKLGVIRKSREFPDRKTSLILYESLVLPHMDYCSLVYTNTTEVNIGRLQLVQNAVCRAILQADNRTHIDDMESELNLPNIHHRLEFQLSVECFKQINVPGNCLSHMFVKKETARRTRASNTNQMVVPRVRTNIGRNAFSYKGPAHGTDYHNRQD